MKITTTTEPEFFTLSEVADRLKISKRTVEGLVDARALAVVHVSARSPRISASALRDFLAAREIKAA